MAVLGDRDIAEYFEAIFEADTADPGRIRAAKYDLTLGGTPLIVPSGKRYPDDGSTTPPRRFLLQPGESAFVSTRERIAMPTFLSGILGSAFELSEEGILLFGGLLIDPGFGYRYENGELARRPEPLSFFLANFGTDPVQLSPGRQRVASIAFLEVTNPRSPAEFGPRFEARTAREALAEHFAPRREDPPKTLGLVRDIRELDHRVDRFEASTFHVVVFGVIVLAVTLFAAIVSLVVSEPATPVVSDLEIDEVLLTVGLVVLELLGLVALFCATVWISRSTLRWRRRRESSKR